MKRLEALIDSGDLAGARRLCLDGLGKDPLDPALNEALVRIIKGTGDHDALRAQIGRVMETSRKVPKRTYSALGSFAFYALPPPGNAELSSVLYMRAHREYPDVPWYYLIIGDIHLYSGKKDEALAEYRLALEEVDPSLLTRDSTSVHRYLLKRIANIYYEKSDFAAAAGAFEEFRRMKAYSFYVTDCNRYVDSLAALGRYDDAVEVLMENLEKMPNKGPLRAKFVEFMERYSDRVSGEFELPPRTLPERKGLPERIPVETGIVTEADDMVEVVREKTSGIARPGDLVALAESVTAITEGRAISVETIEPSFVATRLAAMVQKRSQMAPLGSPHGMQVAIDEVGRGRVLLGLVGGLYDAVTRGKGHFYSLAGMQTALVDDMSGGMPPYDHHVIKGPRDPDATALRVKQQTGLDCCIVDANDQQIAWVIGASEGVDRKHIEQVLSDNPAGNEDQKTPIILIRP